MQKDTTVLCKEEWTLKDLITMRRCDKSWHELEVSQQIRKAVSVLDGLDG